MPLGADAGVLHEDNHVLILTGNGGVFMTDVDDPSLGDLTKPMAFGVGHAEGRRVLQRLADLEMPIVAAVNVPAAVHSEYVLPGDTVVASQTTTFSDLPHLTFGIVPGNGLPLVWEEVPGLNRARYLTLTQGASPPSRPWPGARSPRCWPAAPSSSTATSPSPSASGSAAGWPKAPSSGSRSKD